jgi:hypothetical protein
MKLCIVYVSLSIESCCVYVSISIESCYVYVSKSIDSCYVYVSISIENCYRSNEGIYMYPYPCHPINEPDRYIDAIDTIDT